MRMTPRRRAQLRRRHPHRRIGGRRPVGQDEGQCGRDSEANAAARRRSFAMTDCRSMSRSLRSCRMRLSGDKLPTDTENPATAGAGMDWFADRNRARQPAPIPDGESTITAAYVTFLKKGSDASSGHIWSASTLISLWPSMVHSEWSLTAHSKSQSMARPIDMALRFERTYKPYVVQLLEARQG